ncbi:MAG: hypothetical protein U0984_07890 [Prosthecobacter sp.]|nr:hypothetical protein [Prosthecobacter sp.]
MPADSPPPSPPESPEQAVEAYERAVSEMATVAREAGVKESRFGSAEDEGAVEEVESDFGVGADDAAADAAEAAAEAAGPSEEELRVGEEQSLEAETAKPKDGETQLQQALVTSYEANATRTLQLYPEAGREGTRLFQRMEEIHAALEATNDPLIHDPAKPLVIAQMAARELRIPPQGGGAVSAPARGAAGNGSRARQGSPAPMTAPLGGGKARPAGPTMHPMERAIQEIQTPEQYEALMHGLRRGR